MTHRENLRKQILEWMDDLPEKGLEEVLDFMGSLQGRQESRGPSSDGGDLDPKGDPLLRYAGGTALGCLARDIDAALYGA